MGKGYWMSRLDMWIALGHPPEHWEAKAEASRRDGGAGSEDKVACYVTYASFARLRPDSIFFRRNPVGIGRRVFRE
jgi:hypothetical protein